MDSVNANVFLLRNHNLVKPVQVALSARLQINLAELMRRFCRWGRLKSLEQRVLVVNAMELRRIQKRVLGVPRVKLTRIKRALRHAERCCVVNVIVWVSCVVSGTFWFRRGKRRFNRSAQWLGALILAGSSHEVCMLLVISGKHNCIRVAEVRVAFLNERRLVGRCRRRKCCETVLLRRHKNWADKRLVARRLLVACWAAWHLIHLRSLTFMVLRIKTLRIRVETLLSDGRMLFVTHWESVIHLRGREKRCFALLWAVHAHRPVFRFLARSRKTEHLATCVGNLTLSVRRSFWLQI